jgi:hypothetical protein
MTYRGNLLSFLGYCGYKFSADSPGHCFAVSHMGCFTRYIIDGGAATLDIDNTVHNKITGI